MPGDPLLEVVVRVRQRRRPPLVAGRAVRAHQLVQPVQQRPGVGHVAADRRVGPLPAAVAVEAQVQHDQPGDVLDDVLRVAQRPQPGLRVSFAPTTSWWWKDTPPPGSCRRVAGLPMSCSSAASRSTRSGPVRPSPARSPARARSACARRRPCAGGARRSPAAAPAAPAARRSARPVSTSSSSPRARLPGERPASTARRCTRSAVTRPICPAIAVIASTTSGSTRKPSWATKRAARSIRSGSSPNESSGSAGVRSTPAARSSSPPYGSVKACPGTATPPSRSR